jgi:hypothetical protein
LPPGEAGALIGFRVGCLPGVLEAVSLVTTHGYEHMFAVGGWRGAPVPAASPPGMGKG